MDTNIENNTTQTSLIVPMSIPTPIPTMNEMKSEMCKLDKLIILDLNGVILHRTRSDNANERVVEFRYGFASFLKRLNNEGIAWGVWSTAMPHTVMSLLASILNFFPEDVQYYCPQVVLTQEFCSMNNNNNNNNNQNNKITWPTLKSLDDFWKLHQFNPTVKKYTQSYCPILYDKFNTLIIDDTKEKHIHNNKSNVIIVDSFDGHVHYDNVATDRAEDLDFWQDLYEKIKSKFKKLNSQKFHSHSLDQHQYKSNIYDVSVPDNTKVKTKYNPLKDLGPILNYSRRR